MTTLYPFLEKIHHTIKIAQPSHESVHDHNRSSFTYFKVGIFAPSFLRGYAIRILNPKAKVNKFYWKPNQQNCLRTLRGYDPLEEGLSFYHRLNAPKPSAVVKLINKVVKVVKVGFSFIFDFNNPFRNTNAKISLGHTIARLIHEGRVMVPADLKAAVAP